MDTSQLYAPPIATAPAAPEAPATFSADGGMDLAEEDWATVGSLAKWMRFVSIFYFLGAGFTALAAAWFLFMVAANDFMRDMISSNPWLLVQWAVSPITAVLLFVGGLSLWQSAKHFYGVIVDADGALARGFGKLRRYLIIYGVWVGLQLITAVVSLFTA